MSLKIDMNNKTIYALDFDGVICDSAIETAVSGWKAAKTLWDGFNAPLPSQDILDQFRLVRPILETGYEAILIVKMLHDGQTAGEIINNYAQKIEALIAGSKLNIEALKQLFGETRDQWIENDLASWVEMNPLFEGIAKKLQPLSEQNDWYIVTTKQERFVELILHANQITLAKENIFGLDRKQSKEEVLQGLLNQHPDEHIVFVEDRLPALFNVKNNPNLHAIELILATWGYNTAQDKRDAKQAGFQLIDVDAFLLQT